MSNSKHFIIALMLGFEKDHEIYQGMDWNVAMADGLLTASAITKNDIFSPTHNGKSFFQYKKAWENLPRLIDAMERSGSRLTPEDFRQVIVNGKTAFEMAADCGAVEQTFNARLWVGYGRDMEEKWYALEKYKRPSIGFTELKIALAEAEGRVSREAQLKKMGIQPMEMFEAMKGNKLDTVKRKLQAHGDSLRPADLHVTDIDGDHAFQWSTSWGSFDVVLTDWQKNNEIPGAEFFMFREAGRASIIEKAFNHSMEKKIFNAKVFAGRPEEAVKLYKSLKDEHKKRIDLPGLIMEIVDKECSERITIDWDLSVRDLTKPLYTLHGTDGVRAVMIGLGLRKLWDQMDAVSSILRAKGDSLRLSHLRLPCGASGETCMMRAASYGHMDKVLRIVESGGERLSLHDILQKDEKGRNLLTIVAETRQLDVLLKPALWAGRAGDLSILWDNLPITEKTQQKARFLEVQAQANMLSVRERAAGITPVPALRM